MPFVVGKLPRNAPCQRTLLVLVPPLLADVGRRGSATTRTAPTHGYEPTREAAMAAFAKTWRRE